MDRLHVSLIQRVPSPDGAQADLRLVEPGGYEVSVRCLCRWDGTTEIGTTNPHVFEDFNRKYGDQNLCRQCVAVVVSPFDA